MAQLRKADVRMLAGRETLNGVACPALEIDHDPQNWENPVSDQNRAGFAVQGQVVWKPVFQRGWEAQMSPLARMDHAGSYAIAGPSAVRPEGPGEQQSLQVRRSCAKCSRDDKGLPSQRSARSDIVVDKYCRDDHTRGQRAKVEFGIDRQLQLARVDFGIDSDSSRRNEWRVLSGCSDDEVAIC